MNSFKKQSKWEKMVDIIYWETLRWKPQSKIRTGKFILNIGNKKYTMYPFKIRQTHKKLAGVPISKYFKAKFKLDICKDND